MMKRSKFWLILLAIVLAANLAVGLKVYSVEAEANGEREAFEKTRVMMRVLHLLQKDYVDPSKVDYTDLIYNALRGMVSSLDPFSAFMEPDEYNDMMESTEGQFGGLGIIVTVRDDLLTIVSPIEGTPGSKAGLLAGDQIIKINGTSTRDLKLSDTVKLLKGEPGTSVTITVHRPGTGETKEMTIERALIPVVNVKDDCILEDGVGYVRIVQFNEPTADRLEESLNALVAKKATSLVLDLRNNPGGLLESAVDVASMFLPTDSLVVSTQGRQPSQAREFKTTRSAKFLDKPVAILINGGSASAAEIVAGCLQDWGRAVLIGEKSFGKGSVQNIIELPDGSALRLTTAMYYTPSKRVIHEHGIEPDIEVKLTEEELKRFIEAQRGMDLPAPEDLKTSPDTKEGAEGTPPHTTKGPLRDQQLQRAIDTLKSYDVYRKAQKKRFKELRVNKDAETDAKKGTDSDKEPEPSQDKGDEKK
ncbi:MAG: hypothetical protein A3K19_05395 [Lentisphaerae bacterium RIFOXYB12_FULL_65_16]|nr:MAG: hypothetical protein A3K18_15825 [Lentisphaerae bacterium RIFOXYA12_64_32]OGV94326.1 MAG: hypothetical protein A3K19_05395 [Lentisphaerae bacterium RIFOXYB12_FULL_65_16]